MLDKFPKSLQGLIYQYIDAREVLLMERVSKKTSAGARQDYIWRYLSENTLENAKSKLYADVWKRHYERNINSGKHMTA